jgi:hypothetical protein
MPRETMKIACCTCLLCTITCISVIYYLSDSETPTMACSHLAQLTRLSQPKLSQSVHREECTQCFDDQVCPFCTSSLRVDEQHRFLRTILWASKCA